MGGIVEYVKQYGKVTMQEAPFNEVDNLVMADISYAPFEDFFHGEKKRRIGDIAAELDAMGTEYVEKQPLIYRGALAVLSEMGKVPRFRDMLVYNYVNHVKSKIFLPKTIIYMLIYA